MLGNSTAKVNISLGCSWADQQFINPAMLIYFTLCYYISYCRKRMVCIGASEIISFEMLQLYCHLLILLIHLDSNEMEELNREEFKH